MEENKKRNIIRAITSKKMAAVLSAGLFVLPLAACREKNKEAPMVQTLKMKQMMLKDNYIKIKTAISL